MYTLNSKSAFKIRNNGIIEDIQITDTSLICLYLLIIPLHSINRN